MIRKLWDGVSNDEIIEQMDTDDLWLQQLALKVEILTKTSIDIIDTMKKKKKNMFSISPPWLVRTTSFVPNKCLNEFLKAYRD